MARVNVGITELAMEARLLRSEDGENTEYDRALVELVVRASGLSDEARVSTARSLGIPTAQFESPSPKPPRRLDDWRHEVANDSTRLGYAEWLANQQVPTEITLKVVLDLYPRDDARLAVQEYIAENGVPEPVSVVDLQ